MHASNTVTASPSRHLMMMKMMMMMMMMLMQVDGEQRWERSLV